MFLPLGFGRLDRVPGAFAGYRRWLCRTWVGKILEGAYISNPVLLAMDMVAIFPYCSCCLGGIASRGEIYFC